MFTLAHFSDPHLALRQTPAWTHLLNKRITGYINLRQNRDHSHQDWALDLLLQDLKTRKPDHIALTGDLVNLSLPAEFARTRAWLRDVGRPDQVSVIPGNHDAYVKLPEAKGIGQWADYMTGDLGDRGPSAGALRFPYLRVRGDIGILGISSAVTTRPFMATGKIGRAQLAVIERLLISMRDQGLFRVILIHHPVIADQAKRYKRLVDGNKLLALVARVGADLVLHGHNHTDTLAWCPTPSGRVPVIGIPSASSIDEQLHPPAQYNLYGIAKDGDEWRIDMVSRRLKPKIRMFKTIRRINLVPGSGNLDVSIGEQDGDTDDHAENE
jgi:3',5'-cyclic AMP phosphodiesterase CpdA